MSWSRPQPMLMLLAAILAVVALAGCGEDQGSGADAAAADAAPTRAAGERSSAPTPADSPAATRQSPESPRLTSRSPQVRGTAITTGESEFGEMLFDSRDQAIYLFEPEADGTPACYGECAEAWPPVLTDGIPQAARDVDDGLLGTVQRNDGGTQVTYNGWPLYFYAHEDPGQVLCHDVVLNGGLWLAVSPDGDALPA